MVRDWHQTKLDLKSFKFFKNSSSPHFQFSLPRFKIEIKASKTLNWQFLNNLRNEEKRITLNYIEEYSAQQLSNSAQHYILALHLSTAELGVVIRFLYRKKVK